MNDRATHSAPRKACDLVMKGGITSGVVYPSAVRVLARDYEFRSIGGASAGAIAAVVTAAAEYGRRTGRGGYGQLDRVTGELRKPGFLQGLFQPAPAVRPAFRLLLGMIDRRRSKPRKLSSVVWAGLVAGWWVSVPLVLAGVALVTLTILAGSGPWRPTAVVLAALLAVVAVAAAAVAGLLLLARRVARGLEANGFGMCPGMPQPGADGRALTEWLHEMVQGAAGLPLKEPLTFRHLAEAEGEPIDLRLVTTDLSYGRPVILPTEPGTYVFRREDLDPLFPGEVMDSMWGAEEPAWLTHVSDRDPSSFRAFPAEGLPVLVAARLSLSFPLLLSAVRLWSYSAPDGGIIENWLSDGGISSNFPIHFFDALLPGHPTFGLDLRPGADRPGTEDDVWMPERPTEQLRPR